MSKRFYQFDQFRIDTQNHLLLRNGEIVPLKPKVFDTLLVLVENHGKVLEKDELMNRLWPDTVVEESNLTQNIYVLRRILGEGSGGGSHIETMPKRGYRFVVAVSEIDDDVTGAETSVESVALRVRGVRKTLVAAALSASIFVGLIAYLWFSRQRTTAVNDVKSLAVLPFSSLGSDPADATLGFGMADTLITRLSAIREMTVRPTSAIRKFAAPGQDPVAAGRDLNVDGILEGSVQRAGGTVRVTLRLIRVADGTTVWTGKVDENAGDILALEDRVADEVSRLLVPMMTGDERRLLAKRYTEDSEAHQLYVMGRYHWSKVNPEDWLKAIEYFKSAIEKDSKYALAYTGLADCYLSIVADSQLPKAEAIGNARRASTTALKLDNELAEAHVSLGRIKAYYDWDWSGAGDEFTRAIDLDPNSAAANREYAAYLTAIGQGERAVRAAMHASVLDPLSQVAHFQVAWALIAAHRYDDAVAHSERVLETFPNAHYWIGMADLGRGNYADAIHHFEAVTNRSPDELLAKAHLGYAYGAAGRRAAAEKILAQLNGAYENGRGSPYLLALVYAGLGDKDNTFLWLDKSHSQRSRLLAGLKVNPAWRGLRNDPRFSDLLRRVGLPQ